MPKADLSICGFFADVIAYLKIRQISIPLHRFKVPGLRIGIKRECGVNPQLSRSCKLYNDFQILATFSDGNGKAENRE